MSRYDYEASKAIAAWDAPFYAVIMAAMRQADTDNLRRLKAIFPDTWAELQARYDAPGGLLVTDPEFEPGSAPTGTPKPAATE